MKFVEYMHILIFPGEEGCSFYPIFQKGKATKNLKTYWPTYCLRTVSCLYVLSPFQFFIRIEQSLWTIHYIAKESSVMTCIKMLPSIGKGFGSEVIESLGTWV